jgi:hypothetical protein
MARKPAPPAPEAPALGRDPFADDDLVVRAFFTGDNAVVPAGPTKPRRAAGDKPTHYKVVSISLYNEDIERIDALVASLRERGFTKANRSSVIRFAIDTVDISKMPRGY